jgi:hypothetical protein
MMYSGRSASGEVMFKKKAETPKPLTPAVRPDETTAWEELSYRHPKGFLSSSGLAGVACQECRAPVYGPWAISPISHDILVPHPLLCERCGREEIE